MGIACSMSRRGNCWDNAAMESFFSTLKTERLGRRQYRTRNELRADVFDYIERFYNPKRRHSAIGYISPVQLKICNVLNDVSVKLGEGQVAWSRCQPSPPPLIAAWKLGACAAVSFIVVIPFRPVSAVS
jgi:hypothetical protein